MEAPASASFFTYRSRESGRAREKGYILLHATQPKWLAVNQTTLEIAQSLSRGENIDGVASQLALRYGESFESVRNDVQSISKELDRHGFLNSALSDSHPLRSPGLGSLFVRLTGRCNLACPHCYVSSPSKGDLPASVVLRLIDELKDAGGARIALSGGEPLLHPGIRTILGHLASRMKVQILTNGTLIDREWAGYLAEQGEIHLQISLDGATKETHDRIRGDGSYDRILGAVEHLQRAGLGDRITFSATVMRHNLRDLQEIIRLAESLGVPRVRFLPLRRSGRAREQWSRVGADLGLEDYEQFFDYVLSLSDDRRRAIDVSCGLSGLLFHPAHFGASDGVWCPAGRNLTVEVNGDVYPCALMMRREFLLGNVFHDGLPDLVSSAKMAAMRRALVGRREKIERCAACPWRNFCQGGCMGETLDHKDTVWDVDMFCEYRKKAYQRVFDRFLNDFRRAG